MKSLDNIAEDLFNKIRGRFPSVTIGDQNGKVTTDPITARFFDFDYKEGDRNVGKVSISISEDKLSVMYSNSFVENEDTLTRQNWYNFLKELRVFAKKRLLQFDTRDITKSNLDKRDYKFLAQQGGDTMMSESKLYGTSKVSYQDIGNARLNIRHTQSVNPERRTQHIDKIYVESSEGERFMYPYRHLNGARAMARHVSEGGKPFDDFGKHITGLSEELANLRKFKSYMGRSSVMAESLGEYMDAVAERIQTVKKTVEGLQRETYYKEAVEGFEAPVVEEVPADVAENWVEQLTIKQFNEELADVFPYIYKLVSEVTKAKELTAEDLLGESQCDDCGKSPCECVTEGEHAPYYVVVKGGKPYLKVDAKNVVELKPSNKWDEITPEITAKANKQGFRTVDGEYNNMPFKALLSGEKAFVSQGDYDNMAGGEVDVSPNAEKGDAIENALDSLMGQFATKQVQAQPEKPEVPLSEFILSLFDRENGQFPKGETAVLTAVEKDYGEQYINPAKAFIKRIQETYMTFAERDMEPEMSVTVEPVVSQEENDIMRLAGL